MVKFCDYMEGLSARAAARAEISSRGWKFQPGLKFRKPRVVALKCQPGMKSELGHAQ